MTSRPESTARRARPGAAQRAHAIEEVLAEFLGRPRQHLRGGDPIDVLIGTILSQNTNDRNSHRAYTNLRAKYATWDDALNAPVREIADTIRSGGMAPSKSKRIKALLALLKKRYGSLTMERLRKASDDAILEELVGYDGVGLKTAACVCLFALGRDVFPVDTHVHRLCNRLGLVKTTTPDKTFLAMRAIVPKGRAYAFHTNLIRFGRRVCKAQRPQCGICPLFTLCTWKDRKKYRGAGAVGSATLDFMLMDAL